MSTRFARDCDRCGKTDAPGTKEFGVKVDRRADGAGSMETVCASADLCLPCQAVVLEKLLVRLDWTPDAQSAFETAIGKKVHVM